MENSSNFKLFTNRNLQAMAYAYYEIAVYKLMVNGRMVKIQECEDFEEACFLAMQHVGFIA
jgi:hypothetical protein